MNWTKNDEPKTSLTGKNLSKTLYRHNVRYKRQKSEVTGKTNYQVFKADSTENRMGTLLLASFNLALNLIAMVLLILFCLFNLWFFNKSILISSLHFNFFPFNTSHFSIQVINLAFKDVISSRAIVCITCASFKSVCREEIKWAWGFGSVWSFDSLFKFIWASSVK